MKHLLLLTTCLFFASMAAWADDFDGSLPTIPDGSVGHGGADMTSEENDPHASCLDSRQCDVRTSCLNGRCVPQPTRNAAGCGGGATGSLTLVGTGLGLVLWRRRR